eukprot:CAMPEP_0196144278 /NCGR_PEP_ID=MMETSP0910-20130528/15717_1 /TAXON_ID=49265 /ORGANISM="Thalassiosira rotula, Strain GSO102" /LENGTH=233 /DNA_ID=CAMNT_0041405891 /DNA_START=35 /DNA_END=739 /DNA_ORIENTATION=+
MTPRQISRATPIRTKGSRLLLFAACLHLKECNSFLFYHQCPMGHLGFLSRQPIIIDCEQHRDVHHRLPLASTIFSVPASSQSKAAISTTRMFMGDHSMATLFQVGDTVKVIEDVMKAGKNLKGRTGIVIETWEKCDVDPTCCCAEWVDEGLSVHVKFNVMDEDKDEDENALFANDTFIHYFAESELQEEKQEQEVVAFDGLSCKAFKLDKLSMGAQAKRIAAFEASREEASDK